MTNNQWEAFCNFKISVKNQIEKWNNYAPQLKDLQKIAAQKASTPEYPFEIPVVWNKSLDEITAKDDIKLIVIGDNPGKDEQLAKNSKYLVGQAGKLGENFFKKNPVLNIDFRKNVIILNKTPIHSAKTAQLKIIAKLGGKKIADLIKESQIFMAKQTAKLHTDLCKFDKENLNEKTQLWLVGYSELKQNGIFADYRTELKNYYLQNSKETWKNVFVYQHFSMNRFIIDLNNYIKENQKESESLDKILQELGTVRKNEIFMN